MMNRQQYFSKLNQVADDLAKSYADGVAVNPDNGDNLPRRDEVISVTEKLLELLFPGFDGRRSAGNPVALMAEIHQELSGQICRATRCFTQCRDCGKGCEDNCDEIAFSLLSCLSSLREIIKADVAAAYAGDPAATGFEEIVLSYPGIKATSIQRLAHVLYCAKVPFLPRMMTEYAHSMTGIDIHPGAKLGKGIFIDHGTGVVIGETAQLGDNVRIYQGVTLGAANFPKDACGMLIKGRKRHPTIGNNVTIYSGASVLGDVTIGDDSVIGGNVWLTESLPAGTKITARPPENHLKFAEDR